MTRVKKKSRLRHPFENRLTRKLYLQKIFVRTHLGGLQILLQFLSKRRMKLSLPPLNIFVKIAQLSLFNACWYGTNSVKFVTSLTVKSYRNFKSPLALATSRSPMFFSDSEGWPVSVYL